LGGNAGAAIGAVAICVPGCTVNVDVSGVASSNAASFKPWSTLGGNAGTVIGTVAMCVPGCTVNVDVSGLARRFLLRKRSMTAPPTRLANAAAPLAIATVVIELLREATAVRDASGADGTFGTILGGGNDGEGLSGGGLSGGGSDGGGMEGESNIGGVSGVGDGEGGGGDGTGGGGEGEGGEEGGTGSNSHAPNLSGPQSAQSWHGLHDEYSAPMPPSSQMPSDA